MIDSEQVTFDQSEVKNVGRDLLNSKAAIKLRLGGYSMYPNLLPDDIATVEHIEPASLRLGQVLVVEIDNRWIAHRLVQVRTTNGILYLETQGDSVFKSDGVLDARNLIGVVNQVERNGHRIVLSRVVSQIYLLLLPLPQLASRIGLKVGRKLKQLC
jgi:cell shape-determining protein MreC